MVDTDKGYDEINERGQACIDAIAKLRLQNEDYDRERVQEIMEEMGVRPYGVSSITNYKNGFPELIERRVQILANERTEHKGKELLDHDENGETFIDGTLQHFKDRPYKGESEEAEEVGEDGDELMMMGLTPNTLFKLIRSAQEDAARELFDRMMEWRD